VSVSTGAKEVNSGKRKSEETEEPRKRSRKTSSSDKPGTSSVTNTSATNSRGERR